MTRGATAAGVLFHPRVRNTVATSAATPHGFPGDVTPAVAEDLSQDLAGISPHDQHNAERAGPQGKPTRPTGTLPGISPARSAGDVLRHPLLRDLGRVLLVNLDLG